MIKKITMAIAMSAVLVGFGAGGHDVVAKADGGASSASSTPTVEGPGGLWWP